MKYRGMRILCVVFALLMLSGCATSTAMHDAWFGQDKALHFGYSVVIGAGSSAIVQQACRTSDTASFTIGMLCTVGLGAWKEWFDLRIKGTYWSWKDFFWDVLGGGAGSMLGTRVR